MSEPTKDFVRCALYLDFDNVFSGLATVDPEAALRFAQDPETWMENLKTFGLPLGAERRFLITRSYLNPQGSMLLPTAATPSNESPGQERVYFSKFRPFMTQSGLEVIDCPPLTNYAKNAADIRMVLDIIDVLEHPTSFDEIVLMSGDADFVPLLQRIRARDRRILIASSSQTARSYRVIADTFIDEHSLIGLTNSPSVGGLSDDALEGTESLPIPPGIPRRFETAELATMRQNAMNITVETLASSTTPVLLTELAHLLRNRMGEDLIRESNWFGARTMRAAVTGAATAHLQFNQLHVWDPARHEAPVGRTPNYNLPPAVAQLSTVTGMPRLSNVNYQAVFNEISDYLANHEFSLTEITRAVRDALHDRGVQAARANISFIVQGAIRGGANLRGEEVPTGPELAEAFGKNVVASATTAQMNVDESQQDELRHWLYPEIAAD